MALEISQDFKDIADRLIAKYPNEFGHIDTNEVLFLVNQEKAPKDKCAETRSVKEPYTFITNFKYIITFYEPNILSFTEAQKNILVMHEIMHIDSNFDGKLISHDILDFFSILSTYGVDWDTNPSVQDPL